MCKPHERRETLLTIDNVHVSYGDHPVLAGVTAAIRDVVRPDVANQGQVVAILGPSGVGKTTLFRVLAGFERPQRGRVLIGADQHPVRAGMVGVVHQNYPLFAHRTVLGNLRVAHRDDARAAALLERFGLSDRRDAWPCELSGGQRQRVAILQQLMCNHTYLLMDEPFSGLDPLAKQATCTLISEVARSDEQTTIIVVTHDLREAAKIADTIWLLGHGRTASGERAGSRIVATFDLIARDLAWDPAIEHTARFGEFVRELESHYGRHSQPHATV